MDMALSAMALSAFGLAGKSRMVWHAL